LITCFRYFCSAFAPAPSVPAMQSLNRWLYGPTPEEKVKKWKQTLRTQERQLDREINNVSACPDRFRVLRWRNPAPNRNPPLTAA